MRGGSCISDWGDSFLRSLLHSVRGEYFFFMGLASSLSVSSFSFAVLTFSAWLRLFASRGVNSPLSRLPLFFYRGGGALLPLWGLDLSLGVFPLITCGVYLPLAPLPRLHFGGRLFPGGFSSCHSAG